jgi:hypothetical protein
MATTGTTRSAANDSKPADAPDAKDSRRDVEETLNGTSAMVSEPGTSASDDRTKAELVKDVSEQVSG